MNKMKKALREEKLIQKMLLIIIQRKDKKRQDKTRQDKTRNMKLLENKESIHMNKNLEAIAYDWKGNKSYC